MTADAVVTLVEAHPEPATTPPGLLTTVVTLLAIAAPSLAAALLWIGRASERAASA